MIDTEHRATANPANCAGDGGRVPCVHADLHPAVMTAMRWLRARIVVCIFLLCCCTTRVTRAEPSSKPTDYSSHDHASLVLSLVTTSGEVHVLSLERGETFEASARRFCSGLPVTAAEYQSCVADVVRSWDDLWHQQQQLRDSQETGAGTTPLQSRLEPQPRLLMYHRGTRQSLPATTQPRRAKQPTSNQHPTTPVPKTGSLAMLNALAEARNVTSGRPWSSLAIEELVDGSGHYLFNGVTKNGMRQLTAFVRERVAPLANELPVLAHSHLYFYGDRWITSAGALASNEVRFISIIRHPIKRCVSVYRWEAELFASQDRGPNGTTDQLGVRNGAGSDRGDGVIGAGGGSARLPFLPLDDCAAEDCLQLQPDDRGHRSPSDGSRATVERRMRLGCNNGLTR